MTQPAPGTSLGPADLGQIQALVFRAWKKYEWPVFHFVRFSDDDVTYTRAKAWLTELQPMIAWADVDAPPPLTLGGGSHDARLQLALTTRGLRRLGLAEEVVDRFPFEAKAGMERRARVLGDRIHTPEDETPLVTLPQFEANKPIPLDFQEEGGLDLRECDAMVLLYARTEEQREELLGHLAALVQRHELLHLRDERGARWREAEPFGFADGVSQPVVRGQPWRDRIAPLQPDPALGRPGRAGEAAGSNNEIAAGEIVLGFVNEYGHTPLSPRFDDHYNGPTPALAGKDVGKYGTYLVFRKLEQDVGRFWDSFLELGRRFAGTPVGSGAGPGAACIPTDPVAAARWLASRAMGRWPNGNSMQDCPDTEGDALPQERRNAFSYREDPDGMRCPIGSHVRRANPRDERGHESESSSWKVVRRHRVIRRGRAYGDQLLSIDELLAGQRPVEDSRCGLLFVSLQANISHGFEFVQQLWNNNPAFHGVHQERDPVAGPGYSAFTIPAEPVRVRLRMEKPAPEEELESGDDPYGLPRFVIPRGGGYFFMPSKDTVALLCGAAR